MNKKIKFTNRFALYVGTEAFGLGTIVLNDKQDYVYRVHISITWIALLLVIPKRKGASLTAEIYNPNLVIINGKLKPENMREYDMAYDPELVRMIYTRTNGNRWIPIHNFKVVDNGYLIFNSSINNWEFKGKDEICIFPPETKVKGYVKGKRYIVTDKIGE